MGDTLEITYRYDFGGGSAKTYTVTLDAGTLSMRPLRRDAPPPWAELPYHCCDNCTLDLKSVTHCPIARNLADIVVEFGDFFSYETVSVEVTTAERTYLKETTIQEGLSALLGIVMTTSGCPVMEPLKPMVRFHLPFATLEETLYRMASTWLMAQMFISRSGGTPNLSLSGINRIYAGVAEVNRCIANRLRNEADKDANINAVVNLDFFAAMAPMAFDDLLEQLEPDFSGYLGPRQLPVP